MSETVSKDLLANDVPSKDQLRGENEVRFFGEEDAEFKVVFIGNSITLHAPLESIGWSGDYGMAASSILNDYVHLCVNRLREKYGKVHACIAQLASWEREYWSDTILDEKYTAARDFKADLVISRIGENTCREALGKHSYKDAFDKMVKYFKTNENAKVVVSGMFWRESSLEAAMKAVAEENGYSFVKLEDLGDLDEMKAIGLFEHNGVAAHPGDLGMANIADRLMDAYEKVAK